MTPPSPPTYDLAEIQLKVMMGHYQVTGHARRCASELDLTEADIKGCVCGLTSAEFLKTMISKKPGGAYQDVYKTNWFGTPIYTKLTLRDPAKKAVVVSFALDESPEGRGDS